MDILLQRNLHNTNDKKIRKSPFIKLRSVLSIIFILLGIQLFLQDNSVIAASGIRIYNYTTKKEYTYSDMQIKVTYNGKKISVDSTPGLLESNIALVPYKDIFAKSNVKADCIYDKDAGTVSISKFSTTIVMKIGSKKANINGKEVLAPVAPVKIKYVKENVTKILVPSRFVFENLGYKYTWNKSTCTVAVQRDSEPMLLSFNDDSAFYYSGTQGNVTIDGKEIDLGKMPSIITNNTAMLRAKKVFTDSRINASYKYNKEDKSIILSRNGYILEMKIGSPVATLNGRAIVLDTAPMIISNHDIGSSYVMVPGSITASCLGFDYRWDKNSMTSILTTREDDVFEELPEQIEDDNLDQAIDNAPEQTEDNAPELGDSPVIWDRGTVLHILESNKSLISSSTGIHNIDNGSVEDYGYIYSVSKDYNNMKLNTETYAIAADSPFSIVRSELLGNQIVVQADNMNIVPNTYDLKNASGGMIDSIRTYNAENMSSKLEINVLSDKITYDLFLASDKKTLYVTIYFNSLNNVVVGTVDNMDYITLTGDYPLSIKANQLPGLIYFEIPGMKKSIDEQYISVYNGKSINYLYLFQSQNSTFVYIGLLDSNEYYIVEEGESLTIMFPTKDNPFMPPVSQLPQEPEKPYEPDTPTIPEYPIYNQDEYEIIIPNPAGLNVDQIKHEDQYNKLRFAIRIPGDYTSYLSSSSIYTNSNVIKDVSVFLNSDYETEILVSTSILQGYEIFADASYIYVNVGNPRDIYKNIVVLDPGHGGAAPGAIYNNTKEKDINFKILYEIGKDFFDLNSSSLKVYYTRNSDVDISLANRVAFTEMVGADLFVSLHMNANTDKSVYGTEIYYSSNNNKKNQAGLNSKTLADIFVDNITSSIKTRNRGTRAAKYTVVHNNKVPAILIELGFMSNKNDFDRITNTNIQFEAAKVIYETLLQIFDLYPTGR